MSLVIRQLSALDPEFEACFSIRLNVFVNEQRVPPEEERDRYDAAALHFLALDNDVPLGTARVVMKEDGIAKIGRVAVEKTARRRGIGVALMKAIEIELPRVNLFLLDAQTRALAFYESIGYAALGDEFMEAGIPHRQMTKQPLD